MMNFTGDIKIGGGHIFTANTVSSHDSASHTPGTLHVLGALDLSASLRAGGYTSAL